MGDLEDDDDEEDDGEGCGFVGAGDANSSFEKYFNGAAAAGSSTSNGGP